MLNVLTTKKTKTIKKKKPKGYKEKLGGVGNVYYLDYSDGIIRLCICLNSSICTH